MKRLPPSSFALARHGFPDGPDPPKKSSTMLIYPRSVSTILRLTRGFGVMKQIFDQFYEVLLDRILFALLYRRRPRLSKGVRNHPPAASDKNA